MIKRMFGLFVLKSKEYSNTKFNIRLSLNKNNKTAKFLHLMSFLPFAKYNSLRSPMGYTHHTSYFVHASIKSASFKTLSICLKTF